MLESEPRDPGSPGDSSEWDVYHVGIDRADITVEMAPFILIYLKLLAMSRVHAYEKMQTEKGRMVDNDWADRILGEGGDALVEDASDLTNDLARRIILVLLETMLYYM